MPQHAQFTLASEHKQKQSQLTHVGIDIGLWPGAATRMWMWM